MIWGHQNYLVFLPAKRKAKQISLYERDILEISDLFVYYCAISISNYKLELVFEEDPPYVSRRRNSKDNSREE